MDMKLSIVVPCYNEQDNIPLILERFKDVIKRDDIEVILVNNGSTDNSEKVFEELLPNYPFAKMVKIEVNQGYGYGILQGLNAAVGKYIGWTHADMQTDPNDVIKALDIIEKENKEKIYIKGNRKGRSLFDQFFTFGMGCFETLFMGEFLWDINAQPNIFSRELFDNWQNAPLDFALDLFAFYEARRRGYKIIRMPVMFPERIHGSSHWNTGLAGKWKFIKRTMEFSFKLKKGLNTKKNEAQKV